MGKKRIIIILILIIITSAISYGIFFRDGIIEEMPKIGLKEIILVSIKNLQEKDMPLSLLGEVISQNEVIIKTEAVGEIINVFMAIGEQIERNQIIAEIENSSQRAEIFRAQGAVESAEATLAKTRQGSRQEQVSILELKLKQAEDLLNSAKLSMTDILRSEFALADDIMRNKIDQFFSNPYSSNPQIVFNASNLQLEIDVEFERFSIEEMLKSWSKELEIVGKESDLFLHLENADANLKKIREFLDKTALLVNNLNSNANLSQTTVDGWKSAVLTSRTNINNAISAISLAKDNLNNKISSFAIAEKEQEETIAGGRGEDVLQAEAVLKQMRGSLRLAQVNLEKTIIRSPINGIINELAIKRGDFVSMFEQVAIVSNNSLLEIITYITEEDRNRIHIGGQAKIEGEFNGIVSEIAPALDKKTKKIEIKVAIEDTEADFIEGESVELLVDRTFTIEGIAREIIIPISSLKIKTDDIFVFTVDDKKKLVEHIVSVGSIVGNGIIILSGIDINDEIVLDARGLKAGQEVIVKNSI